MVRRVPWRITLSEAGDAPGFWSFSMIPKQPPRDGQSGFLYLPPYRVHGISVAGEYTTITIPEFGVTFDMGQCTRASLTSDLIALSHSHMDHVGAIPYWFSQRYFQKLEGGRVLCHPEVAGPLRRMLASWVDLERQKTPNEVVEIEPDADIEIRQNVILRAVETRHTCPSLGYAIIENRHKLKTEFTDLPQSELRRIRGEGEELTVKTEIPLVAYTGDTDRGEFLERDEFAKAKIVIAECTFFDEDHRGRARIGRHLHLDDLADLLPKWEAEHIVLVHLSRRTLLSDARERLATLGDHADRVHLLMDHRTNRRRYESQLAEVAEVADAKTEGDSTEKSSGSVPSEGLREKG